jgi:hypothetical protein
MLRTDPLRFAVDSSSHRRAGSLSGQAPGRWLRCAMTTRERHSARELRGRGRASAPRAVATASTSANIVALGRSPLVVPAHDDDALLRNGAAEIRGQNWARCRRRNGRHQDRQLRRDDGPSRDGHRTAGAGMRSSRLVAVGAAAGVIAAALWWRKHPLSLPVQPPLLGRATAPTHHPTPPARRARSSSRRRLLEVGPGTGDYSLDVARWLLPGRPARDLSSYSRRCSTTPRTLRARPSGGDAARSSRRHHLPVARSGRAPRFVRALSRREGGRDATALPPRCCV